MHFMIFFIVTAWEMNNYSLGQKAWFLARMYVTFLVFHIYVPNWFGLGYNPL